MSAAISVDLSSPWAFGVVVGLALVDGIVPLVPARTSVIALGVLAGTGDRRAYPLLLLATLAAFVSDNIAYWLGAHYWGPISRIVFVGGRAQRAWVWLSGQVRRHGLILVALARVLPGGPTPITLTAGSLRLPIGRFRAGAAISAVLWSAYAFTVGVTGDALVGDNLLLALAVALLLAGGLNLGLRALLRHRRRRESGGDTEAPAS